MITIHIPKATFYDERKAEVITIEKPLTLNLEYSLISISEWEAKTHKPFLTTEEKSVDEWVYLFYCMTINKNGLDYRTFYALTQTDYQRLMDYIKDPMTATTITNHSNTTKPAKRMTSEELFAAMSILNIPYECKKWHLNRLIMLIDVCAIKNSPPEKMSKSETAKSWRELNARNRARFNSKG